MGFRWKSSFLVPLFLAGTNVASAKAPADRDALLLEARGIEAIVPNSRVGTITYGELRKGKSGVYPLRLKAGEAANIKVSSQDFDALFEVRNGQNEELANDDDSGGSRDAELRFLAPTEKAGVFYIVVMAQEDGVGRFAIEVSKLKVEPPTKPVPLAVGATTNGRVDRTSPWDNKTGEGYQRFPLEGKAGDRIRLTATPTDGEKVLGLRLYDATGTKIFGVSNTSPIIVKTLPADGAYEAEVTYKPERKGGDAKFVLSLEALPAASYIADALDVVPGTPINGSFGPDSPVLKDTNAPFALFTVHGEAGQRFRANVEVSGIARNSKAVMARPTLLVGSDTPAGFASVARILPLSFYRQPATFRFWEKGEITIRLIGTTGVEGDYTLKVDLVLDAPPPPASIE